MTPTIIEKRLGVLKVKNIQFNRIDKFSIHKWFHKYKEAWMDCDFVLITENDNWYSGQYIEIFIEKWCLCNRPALLGMPVTHYFNVEQKTHKAITTKENVNIFTTGFRPEVFKDFDFEKNQDLEKAFWEFNLGFMFDTREPLHIRFNLEGVPTDGWVKDWVEAPKFCV